MWELLKTFSFVIEDIDGTMVGAISKLLFIFDPKDLLADNVSFFHFNFK